MFWCHMNNNSSVCFGHCNRIITFHVTKQIVTSPVLTPTPRWNRDCPFRMSVSCQLQGDLWIRPSLLLLLIKTFTTGFPIQAASQPVKHHDAVHRTDRNVCKLPIARRPLDTAQSSSASYQNFYDWFSNPGSISARQAP